MANIVDLLERMIERNITPDLLTDQTSAHDALVGYLPQGMSVEEGKVLREENPNEYINRSTDTMVKHTELMIALQSKGAITFDYGNNLRGQALGKRIKKCF